MKNEIDVTGLEEVLSTNRGRKTSFRDKAKLRFSDRAINITILNIGVILHFFKFYSSFNSLSSSTEWIQ